MRLFLALLPVAILLAACGRNGNTPPSVPAGGTTLTEVHASNGGVGVSLAVASTSLKAGESIWFRLRLRNDGTKPLAVTEELFWSPYRFYKNLDGRFGLFLECRDQEGKPLPVRVPRLKDDFDSSRRESSSATELGDFDRVSLEPGQNIDSPAWSLKDAPKGVDAVTATRGLTELPFFRFEKPGRYTLRAVYDWTSRKRPGAARVETEWMVIEVH